VNLISHFWTLRSFMPKMMENNHGHIVTTASLGAFIGGRHCVPYFAAKYGIRGEIESLQDELIAHPSQPTSIKFTTVFPAFVQTPLTAKVKLQGRLRWVILMIWLMNCLFQLLFYKFNSSTGTGRDGFLKADYVAEQIVNGIRQNQEKVIIPKAAEFVVLLKR
jgi:short-subunit dehydrogenase